MLSIQPRINDHWRMCFSWATGGQGSSDDEIVDSHSGENDGNALRYIPGEHIPEDWGALPMSAAELARQLDVPANRVSQTVNGGARLAAAQSFNTFE
ncbi:MAG: hypothetical protein ACRD28_02385 [Acidobacteriaceae bacterium]